jgi:transposase
MRTVTLNERQQNEVEILTRLEAGAVDIGAAGELLGIGERQLRRLRARFRQEGMAAVIHGNRGRSPANRTDPALVERILALAGEEGKYHDLNVCHLCDLLAQEEGITIGRSTLDRLLKQQGVRRRARRALAAHRRQRQRRSAEGMLLQIDGSPFHWLEERGPEGCLMGAIDDATGKILVLLLRLTEDQLGYLLLLRDIAQHHGLPMAFYHDCHTILRSPKKPTLDEQLAGQTPMSQIQRIMAELGVESIAAHSPQAKGRIERLWKTLQDRLTKELRLAGITTLEEANAFLPAFIERYNARFAQPAQDPTPAWVPLPEDVDLDYYFAIRETRLVRADHCLSFSGQILQLEPGPRDASLVGKRISVHLTPEGEIHLYDGKRALAYRPFVAPAIAAASPAAAPLPPQAPGQIPPVPISPPPKRTAGQRRWLYGQT